MLLSKILTYIHLKQKQVLTNLPLLFHCRLPTAIGRPLPIADSNSKTQQNAMYKVNQIHSNVHYIVHSKVQVSSKSEREAGRGPQGPK